MKSDRIIMANDNLPIEKVCLKLTMDLLGQVVIDLRRMSSVCQNIDGKRALLIAAKNYEDVLEKAREW